jgi:hypothetical protein
LADWSADLEVSKAPNLNDAVLGFESKFQPPNAAVLGGAKTALEASMAKLNRFLKASGAAETAWKTYLHWNELDEQLKATAPDPKALATIERQYVADYPGLELPVFADVGNALQRYAELLESEQGNLREQYIDQLKGLAGELVHYAAGPTSELAEAIGNRLAWLQRMGQAPKLVRYVRARYSKPNLFAAISGRLVAAGINQPVDDTGPVRDVIMGTDISGTARTVGHIYAQLVPSEDDAVIETLLIGTASSRTVGYNGPATIHSSGTTQIRGLKRIVIDENGIHALPATATAATKTQITGIAAGGNIAQRVATNRVYESKSEAEQIAGQHAAVRARQRVDQQARSQLEKSQASFLEKFRNPLLRRRAFPEVLNFRTTQQSLFVTMLQANRNQLAAPSAPPEIDVLSDLAIRIHESWINNFAAATLSGATLKQEEVEAQMIDLRGSLPEQIKSDENRGPWAITLADTDPITVRFPEGGMKITIRGRRYKSGEDVFRGMNVTAEYKIEQNGDSFVLRRQGELQLAPPDSEGKTQSTRQVTLKTLLKRKFGKIFEPEIKSEGLILPGRWKDVGRLDPKQMVSKQGWLAMAWLESGQPARQEGDNPAAPAVARDAE